MQLHIGDPDITLSTVCMDRGGDKLTEPKIDEVSFPPDVLDYLFVIVKMMPVDLLASWVHLIGECKRRECIDGF